METEDKFVDFTATLQQMAQVAANAVNASVPYGMGLLHYDLGRTFEPKEFIEIIKGDPFWLNLDYVQGRMVKLSIWRGKGKNAWRYPSFEPRSDYQSWIQKYPTYPDLLRSAGIELHNGTQKEA